MRLILSHLILFENIYILSFYIKSIEKIYIISVYFIFFEYQIVTKRSFDIIFCFLFPTLNRNQRILKLKNKDKENKIKKQPMIGLKKNNKYKNMKKYK